MKGLLLNNETLTYLRKCSYKLSCPKRLSKIAMDQSRITPKWNSEARNNFSFVGVGGVGGREQL